MQQGHTTTNKCSFVNNIMFYQEHVVLLTTLINIKVDCNFYMILMQFLLKCVSKAFCTYMTMPFILEMQFVQLQFAIYRKYSQHTQCLTKCANCTYFQYKYAMQLTILIKHLYLNIFSSYFMLIKGFRYLPWGLLDKG